MYSLCAIVGAAVSLSRHPPVHSDARVIALAEGFGLIPLTESVLGEVQHSGNPGPRGPSVSGSFEFLSLPLEGWAQALSVACSVLYLETEYFGGEGFERAVVWQGGNVTLGPLERAGATNESLRTLGVVAPPGREELDLVGLNRCRSVEEWLETAR